MRFFIPALLSLLLFHAPLFASTIYVKTVKSGNGTGVDWASAANLQDAISSAVSGDELWVAAGNYLAHPTLKTESFTLTDGISLFGGFSGNGLETIKDERDWSFHQTILSGEINTGANTDNTEIIVQMGNNTILDGFIVEGGNNSSGSDIGVVFANLVTGFELNNCVFRNNIASSSGAGFTFHSTSTYRYGIIYNCIFENNTASGFDGAAIFAWEYSSLDIINSVFVDNYSGRNSAITFRNGHTAGNVINCTIVNNHAVSAAGGLGATSLVQIDNTIIRMNTSGGAVKNISDMGGGGGNVGYSNIEGDSASFTSSTNLDLAENFLDVNDPSGPDGLYFTEDDGLRIVSPSPSIA